MKKSKILAIVAANLALVMSAGAQFTFDLSYSDTSGDVGSGVLQATYNGGGVYTAVSGTFDMTAGLYGPAVFTLAPDPNAPSMVIFAFYGGDNQSWDNQLFPGSSSLVNINGLLFNDPTYPQTGGQGLLINLYNNGSGYALEYDGYNYQPYDQVVPGGTLTLTAVPESSGTGLMFGLGAMIPLIFMARRQTAKA